MLLYLRESHFEKLSQNASIHVSCYVRELENSREYFIIIYANKVEFCRTQQLMSEELFTLDKLAKNLVQILHDLMLYGFTHVPIIRDENLIGEFLTIINNGDDGTDNYLHSDMFSSIRTFNEVEMQLLVNTMKQYITSLEDLK